MDEKEFPNLIKATKKFCDDFGRTYFSLGEAPFHLIEECCLDKQKVTDAINKFGSRTDKTVVAELKKDLGLE